MTEHVTENVGKNEGKGEDFYSAQPSRRSILVSTMGMLTDGQIRAMYKVGNQRLGRLRGGQRNVSKKPAVCFWANACATRTLRTRAGRGHPRVYKAYTRGSHARSHFKH